MRIASTWIVLFALIAGGVAGAVAARMALPTTERTRRELDTTSVIATTHDSDLAPRIAALESEQRALAEQIARLRQGQLASARLPAQEGGVSRAAFEALSKKVEGLNPVTVNTNTEPIVFKEQVADALAAIRQEESHAAVRLQQEKRRARLDGDVEVITKKLTLTPAQSDRLRDTLLAQYEREDGLRRMWEDGVDRELVGQRKQEDGQRFADDLATFLTPEQVQSFWIVNSSKRGSN